MLQLLLKPLHKPTPNNLLNRPQNPNTLINPLHTKQHLILQPQTSSIDQQETKLNHIALNSMDHKIFLEHDL